MESSVYLDYNSTTPTDPEVIEAMMPFLHEAWANPSSAHGFGNQVRRAVDRAREQVATLIGAEEPNEIIFTSGATESNNTVVQSALSFSAKSTTLITSPAEHAAIIVPAQQLENRGGSVCWLEVDKNGSPDLNSFDDALNKVNNPLISLMWANNETGVINPIPTLAERAAEKGALFHTDAVQMTGKLPFRIKDLPIQLLSISGHKIYGPKGIGALYVRRGTRVAPYLVGGHQERARRAGTENVPAIIGFGKACELAASSMEVDATRINRLRDQLEHNILISCKGAVLQAADAKRLPNTSNISFDRLDGEAILFMLDDKQISVSTGSACESGSLEASHVLKAMGVESRYLNGSIRFSLGKQTTENDINRLIEVLPPIIDRCRDLAPHIDTDA
ncbi:MAG: cysteine desulfurase family protein [Pontiellaceae bacterium]